MDSGLGHPGSSVADLGPNSDSIVYIYPKVKEGFPLRLYMYQQLPFGTPSSYETEQTPMPYGFPLDFDSLTQSE